MLIISQKKVRFGNKLKIFRSNKNELNELTKKVKAISAKGLKKKMFYCS